MNQSRLQSSPDLSESSASTTTACTSHRLADKIDKIIFNPDYIFCNDEGRKNVQIGGVWTTEDTYKFEQYGWKTIIKVAEKRNDEKRLTRIRGYDLFANEAQYHRHCCAKFLQTPDYWLSENEAEKIKQKELEQAHRHAFGKVCDMIGEEIVNGHSIMKVNDLCKLYVVTLQNTNQPSANQRGENLKTKLEKHDVHKEMLSFCKLDEKEKFQTYLVYNVDTSTELAVKFAYRLGTTDMIAEVSIYLWKVIHEAYQKSGNVPWPPTEEYMYLQNMEIIPSQLQKFLNYLIPGKPDNHIKRVNRMNSIGQDICIAATHGQLKLPKHILICMTLAHLF